MPPLPPTFDYRPPPGLDIVHEDERLIVCNKPSGLLTVAGKDPSLSDCLEARVQARRPDRPDTKVVHRLDKDTSGVMVAAKTERAHKHLSEQFADHGRTGPLHRAYIAYAWGSTQSGMGTVDAPLGRDPGNRLKQAVLRHGREAITHYAVEARYGEPGWDITRIQCQLETGRTHQIRVHMAHIGHPLVADTLYAPGFATKVNKLPEDVAKAVQALGRQALHAAELGFEHPASGEEMMFAADLPDDLQALDDALAPYDQVTRRG